MLGDKNVNTLGEIVTVEVTDPYSVSLATDSARSQFVNLDDADLKPALAGMAGSSFGLRRTPEDITLYELHVRDFSVADESVSEANRGRFMAFTELGSDGMTHLSELQSAGLSHVHLLPSFDIATVLENRAERIETDDLVDDLCAAVACGCRCAVPDLQRPDHSPGAGIHRRLLDAAATNRDLDGRSRRFQLGL